MSNEKQVCLTLGAALQEAIEMENAILNDFMSSLNVVENEHAQKVLKETALAKLAQKHALEQALIEGSVDGADLHAAVPTMQLSQQYGKRTLSTDADTRDALSYAIHLVTVAVAFYHDMASACEGAPMSSIFKRLGNEQTGLLQELEDSYEEHFLTEN